MSQINTVLIVDFHSIGFADSLVASWKIGVKHGPLRELYVMTHAGLRRDERETIQMLFGRVRFHRKPYPDSPTNGQYLAALVGTLLMHDEVDQILVLTKQVRKLAPLMDQLERAGRAVEFLHPGDWVNKDTRDKTVWDLSKLPSYLEIQVGDWYDLDDFEYGMDYLNGSTVYEELGVGSLRELVLHLPHLFDVQLIGEKMHICVSPRIEYV